MPTRLAWPCIRLRRCVAVPTHSAIPFGYREFFLDSLPCLALPPCIADREPPALDLADAGFQRGVSDRLCWTGDRPHQGRRHLPTPRSRQRMRSLSASSLLVRHPIGSISGLRRGPRRRTAEAIDRFLTRVAQVGAQAADKRLRSPCAEWPRRCRDNDGVARTNAQFSHANLTGPSRPAAVAAADELQPRPRCRQSRG
jgi:hypothetical protein